MSDGFVILVLNLQQSTAEGFVRYYDPSFGDGRGRVDLTMKLSEAKVFSTPDEALAYYEQEHGLRPDGKPNRPLTAYSVEITSVGNAGDWVQRIASDRDVICDFCGAPSVKWSYEVDDFVTPTLPDPMREGQTWDETSMGGWAACDPCHEMVEAKDYDSLLGRSLENYVVKYRAYSILDQRIARDHIRMLQALFFEHRTGEAKPWTPVV